MNITPDNYAEKRNEIKTGDLITVSFSTGLFWMLVAFITRSKRSHSGIALWHGDTLFIAEQNPQAPSLVRLSQYMYRISVIEVTTPPIAFTKNVIEAAIMDKLRDPMPYSYYQLVLAGLERITGFPLVPAQAYGNSAICSMWALAIYIEVDGRISPKDQGVFDPDELIEYFIKLNSLKET